MHTESYNGNNPILLPKAKYYIVQFNLTLSVRGQDIHQVKMMRWEGTMVIVN